jgi:molybdopterin converting factor small subunit
MAITVKLYGILRGKVSQQDLEPDLDSGLPLTKVIYQNIFKKVYDILQRFNIDEEEVSHIFVNSEYCGPGKEVKDGDRVGIFPKKMALMFAEIPHRNSIKITVKLFATLRKYGPDKLYLELPEGSTIKVVLNKVKIPKEEKNLILMINGLPLYDRNFVLKNQDTLAIFPPLAGG